MVRLVLSALLLLSLGMVVWALMFGEVPWISCLYSPSGAAPPGAG